MILFLKHNPIIKWERPVTFILLRSCFFIISHVLFYWRDPHFHFSCFVLLESSCVLVKVDFTCKPLPQSSGSEHWSLGGDEPGWGVEVRWGGARPRAAACHQERNSSFGAKAKFQATSTLESPDMSVASVYWLRFDLFKALHFIY